MTTAQAAGAQPIITVNYGTGTPALAAAWVQDADVTNNYGIQYWEVGNEVYGNGTYGANWEADSHCETSLNGPAVTIGSEPSQTYDCGPTQYADNVLQYISAMKAVDPDIHVCADADHARVLAGRRDQLRVPAVLEPDGAVDPRVADRAA